jgi:hypothetical protein
MRLWGKISLKRDCILQALREKKCENHTLKAAEYRGRGRNSNKRG